MLCVAARRIALAALLAGCGTGRASVVADLVVTHATVLDVQTGTVLRDYAVMSSNGMITSVGPSDDNALHSAHVIDARGRLLTPGFIDAHFHMCSIYAPSCTNPRGPSAHLVMLPDSIAAYRRYMSSLYLPFGVTAVRDVGSDEHLMPMLLAWMKRAPEAPDYFPVGADLISPDPYHTPAPWQVEVDDSLAADAKVREYHSLGIRNIKLYWRLQEPAFRSALRAANALDMNLTAHVDFNIVPVDRALDLGVRNIEHMTAWEPVALQPAALDQIYRDVAQRLKRSDGQIPGYYYLAVPEIWNVIGPNNPRLIALVEKFRATNASVTPTLHIFAQRLGLTWFMTPARDAAEDATAFSLQDRDRAVAGYRIMAGSVKRLHDAGVRLNVGTDTPDPGKSVLSEMLLLHDAGISMTDVFRIATFETANGIGHAADLGSITIGKRANMILFEENPLLDPRGLLSAKTVIKDGNVVSH